MKKGRTVPVLPFPHPAIQVRPRLLGNEECPHYLSWPFGAGSEAAVRGIQAAGEFEKR